MADSYHELAINDKAEELAQMALAIARRQARAGIAPAAADALALLGSIKMRQGDLVNAEKLTREALEISRKVHGPDSSQVAECINNIATININKGDGS